MTTSKATDFATVTEAIEEIRAGRMVVILDSEDRENEGDLVMAAQFATPEAINFMATHGRGLICLALTPARCDQLGLKPVVKRNEAPHGEARRAGRLDRPAHRLRRLHRGRLPLACRRQASRRHGQGGCLGP